MRYKRTSFRWAHLKNPVRKNLGAGWLLIKDHIFENLRPPPLPLNLSHNTVWPLPISIDPRWMPPFIRTRVEANYLWRRTDEARGVSQGKYRMEASSLRSAVSLR